MPWQLVSSQAGLRGAAGEKDESDRKSQEPLPGAGAPRGGGKRSHGEAEPTGLYLGRMTRLARAALSDPAGRCHGLSRCPGPGSPITDP